MYAKITKSGNKLLINIPKEHKENFPYLSPVKIISLKEEEDKENIDEYGNITKPIGVAIKINEMKSYDAVKIIKDLDKTYDITNKTTEQIIVYAKELIKGEKKE